MSDELKPVAWAHMVSGEIGSITYSKGVAGSWEATGVKATPLYAIPEGYALVPVEPTEAMVDAALATVDDDTIPEDQYVQASYRAMITAAQEEMK